MRFNAELAREMAIKSNERQKPRELSKLLERIALQADMGRFSYHSQERFTDAFYIADKLRDLGFRVNYNADAMDIKW